MNSRIANLQQSAVRGQKEKFVRSKEWIKSFCRARENAERWIRYRRNTGYNYRHQTAFFERLVELSDLRPGCKVLYLCCGEGSLLRMLLDSRKA